MTNQEIKTRLTMAATAFDRRAQGRKFWNPYALPQYFQAIDRVMADIERGATPRQAVLCAFCDRLLSAMLKGIGEKDFTIEERHEANMRPAYYTPAKPE
jgi:hypothetical protein